MFGEYSKRWLTGYRGYDDGKLVSRLRDEYRIKPVIDTRNTWKDPDTTRVVSGQENVTYDWRGTIRCVCPQRQYGYECAGSDRCPVRSGIRIPLEENGRIFTPVARSSYQWKRFYNTRSALERINSRFDTSFGFERHTIRGLCDPRIAKDVDDGDYLTLVDVSRGGWPNRWKATRIDTKASENRIANQTCVQTKPSPGRIMPKVRRENTETRTDACVWRVVRDFSNNGPSVRWTLGLIVDASICRFPH